jgi:hypothetical protein
MHNQKKSIGEILKRRVIQAISIVSLIYLIAGESISTKGFILVLFAAFIIPVMVINVIKHIKSQNGEVSYWKIGTAEEFTKTESKTLQEGEVESALSVFSAESSEEKSYYGKKKETGKHIIIAIAIVLAACILFGGASEAGALIFILIAILYFVLRKGKAKKNEAESAKNSGEQALEPAEAERPKESLQPTPPAALKVEETQSAAPIFSEESSEEEKISDGVKKSFFESGGVRTETTYKNGKKEGKEKHYFENRRVRLSSPYKNGLIDGIEKEYNEEGILIRETRYNDGEKQGAEKLCHPNGRVRSSVRYGKKGKREGEARFYDEYSKVLAEIDYSDDKPISGFTADKKSGKKKALSAQELEKYI